MKEPDWKEFITSMVNEVTYQMDNESYSIIPKSQVPNGVTILPAVWKMKCKQDREKRDIKRWKALLNIYG